MVNTYRNDGLPAGGGSAHNDDAAACAAHDLKGLLNTLVTQVSDADRRHSEALHHMQERLASLGREAQNLKDRVPDRFLAAFERIEAGMADLASNIGSADAPAVAPTATTASQSPLRSAADVGSASNPSQTRPSYREDTFDVVELSVPPSWSDSNETEVDEPWGQDAADALAGLYDEDAPSFQPSAAMAAAPQPMALSSGIDFGLVTPGANVAPSMSSTSHSGSNADHAWFEARFAEITKRLDESLADIRPDQSFFAIGQRLDSVEQSISQLIDATASTPDAGNIQIIESHIGELAGHLDHTLTQLSRLDAIENYLADISGRLAEVQQIATSSMDDGGAGTSTGIAFDPHTIARAAVDEAAHRFASIHNPASSGDEVRPLIERFMSDARQGEENTHALLDTLQQAMIRLLDRVDNMELAQHNVMQPETNPYTSPVSFATAPAMSAPSADHDRHPSSISIDAQRPEIVQERAAKSKPVVETPALDPVDDAPKLRSNAQLRQDFIADARRAKMRLSTGGETSLDAAGDPLAVDAPTGAKAAKASKGAKAKTALGAQQNSPARMAILAVGALAVAGGGWYVFNKSRGGNAAPAMTVLEDVAPVAKKKSADGAPVQKPNQAKPKPAAAPETEKLRMPDGTRGEIVPDNLTVGQAQIPMLGVAVETAEQVQAADLERSERRQQLATLSNKLGSVAASINNGIATPTSLVPGFAESEAVRPADGETVAKAAPAIAQLSDLAEATVSGGKSSNALDMPPAIVGPLSLRLAAANGDPSAEFDVGSRLAEGKGGSQNFKDAAKWYQRSADKGFAQSQYRLGTLYERGLGLKADPARAREWYQQAAESGHIKAMHNLAVMSANQAGGSPDYASAAEWFTKAAERGLSDSQFNLAVLYENGLGVEQNLVESFKWLSLAARGGESGCLDCSLEKPANRENRQRRSRRQRSLEEKSSQRRQRLRPICPACRHTGLSRFAKRGRLSELSVARTATG
jgi:localization factor PodJL